MAAGTIWNLTTQDMVIRLGGEIDYTVTPQVRDELLAAINNGTGDVTLDLEELEYLDSSGLAIFIEARKILQGKDRNLVLTNLQSPVRKVFVLTQVHTLFGL